MTDFKAPFEWSENVEDTTYETLSDISWGIGHAASSIRLTIPAGRRFDVSVPKGLRWLFDPHDLRYRAAGLIHDELLHVHQWTRMRAGGEFHDALRAGGTPPIRAIVMWLGVSIFRYPLSSEA